MNLIDILAFIQATEDGQGLRIIHGAVQQRQRTLTKEVALRRATEAWDRVKCHKRGDVLYCCAEGTFIGGPLQRGDKMTVYAVQPRKKILWVTVKGNKYSLAFPPGPLHAIICASIARRTRSLHKRAILWRVLAKLWRE